jgi:hypothetical protein
MAGCSFATGAVGRRAGPSGHRRLVCLALVMWSLCAAPARVGAAAEAKGSRSMRDSLFDEASHLVRKVGEQVGVAALSCVHNACVE